MNALMIGLFDGELKDFYNGIDAIRDQNIALIDEKKFKEDSLRVLRSVQFSARLGFRLETKTLQIMEHIPLDDISPHRIATEFQKLFNAPNICI